MMHTYQKRIWLIAQFDYEPNMTLFAEKIQSLEEH